jgi:hypothetical protein
VQRHAGSFPSCLSHAISPIPLRTSLSVLLPLPTTLPHNRCSPGCPLVALTRANFSIPSLFLSYCISSPACCDAPPPTSPIGSLAHAWSDLFPQVRQSYAFSDFIHFISTDFSRAASRLYCWKQVVGLVGKLPGGGLARSIDPEWNLECETWGFPKEVLQSVYRLSVTVDNRFGSKGEVESVYWLDIPEGPTLGGARSDFGPESR